MMMMFRKFSLSVFSLSVLFFAYLQGEASSQERYTVIKDVATLPVFTPSIACWEKDKIRLANNLEAFLISDPAADQSGALLSVNVGSWDDPEDHPGIAHFLEHMLFLGTKTYPDEGGYHQFIHEHGGETNAFTSNSITNYLFTASNEAFDEGLKRFSCFFKEPLFNPSGVSRELHAIDQEYAKNIEHDLMRQIFVLKELSNPKHPFHRFNIGNSHTLSNVTRQTLKNWYENHYSANLMRLVVYSPLPIEVLRQLVVNEFSGIPNTNRKSLKIETEAFQDDMQGKYVYIEPIKNTRQLMLMWEMPAKFAYMKETQPEAIICHVLGHEGEKSLLAQLKKEHYAENLACGGIKLGNNLFTVYLQIDLTDEGLKHVDRVIGRSFQAIRNFRKQGVPGYLFEEVKTMQTIHYQNQSKRKAFQMLMKHADNILEEENLATYPEVSHIIQRFDPGVVKEMLDLMAPEKGHIFISAPSMLTGVAMDRKEKWLGVDYAIKPVSEKTKGQWERLGSHPEISLPSPNMFIPKNVQLLTSSDASEHHIPTPKLLVDDEGARIYFAEDKKFHIPKVSWILHIRTPEMTLSNPVSVVIGDLYVKSLKDALAKFSYPALIAGLDYTITRKNNGIQIQIGGYSQNAHLLLDEILRTIKAFKPVEEKFAICKNSLLRSYENFSKESPFEQSVELFKSVLFEHYVPEREKAAAIEKLTFETFKESVSHLFDRTFIEGMLYGNMTEGQAKTQAESVKATFNQGIYPRNEQQKVAVVVLPQEEGPFYLETQAGVQGNAVLLAIQESTFSFKEKAAQQVLMQSIKEPFFSTLRTKQQTGYLVHSFPQEVEKKLFNLFAVQSNTHDVVDLLYRFEAFIESYLQELGKTNLTQEQFSHIKTSLLKHLEEPAKNIDEMGEFLFTCAFQHDGDFDRIGKRIEGFRELTYDECLQIGRKFFGKQNRRRLAILLQGSVKNDFIYSRAPTWNAIRDMSRYEER